MYFVDFPSRGSFTDDEWGLLLLPGQPHDLEESDLSVTGSLCSSSFERRTTGRPNTGVRLSSANVHMGSARI